METFSRKQKFKYNQLVRDLKIFIRSTKKTGKTLEDYLNDLKAEVVLKSKRLGNMCATDKTHVVRVENGWGFKRKQGKAPSLKSERGSFSWRKKPKVQEKPVTEKSVLTSLGKPYQSMEHAKSALKSKRLQDMDVNERTHEIRKVDGGYGLFEKESSKKPRDLYDSTDLGKVEQDKRIEKYKRKSAGKVVTQLEPEIAANLASKAQKIKEVAKNHNNTPEPLSETKEYIFESKTKSKMKDAVKEKLLDVIKWGIIIFFISIAFYLIFPKYSFRGPDGYVWYRCNSITGQVEKWDRSTTNWTKQD